MAHSHTRMPTERSFGLSVGGACAAVAAIAWWRGYTRVSTAFAVAAVLLLAGGLMAPALLRVPNRIWWRFAQVLGWVNARILLTAVFAIVLTPVGVVMRALGRSPLQPAAPDTNWSAARRRDRRHYERMY